MIAVIQRTKLGAVKVKDKIIGQIDKGFVIFLGVTDTDKGKVLYEYFMGQLKSKDITISSGEFGATMEVSLVNDGPATFVLDSNNH